MDLSLIESAVQYIETNLKQPLLAEDVSRSVHVSYYHFHRIFHAMTGETIGDYIRRRRLTEAALELLAGQRPILDIALDYQFESQEAFGRAFKKVFGFTPNGFRRKSARPVVNEKGALVGRRLQHRFDNISIEPELTELTTAISLVGLQGRTNLRDNRIPLMWSELVRRRQELTNAGAGGTAYGICQAMDAMPVHDLTEDTEFTQFVGFECAECGDIPSGMLVYTIQCGKYAVFRHRGPTALLRDSYEYIWGTWLYSTSYELDNRDDFEMYGDDFRGTENEESVIWIYIPVR
ncbi:GyrI-like domain-containing protein [Paenibacillus profundus]|uniref:GyrI-like domain-containing protein n=1 Tax=Paenibacillus profundus TaxID=1173085 RepID=A0ABS8YTF3_9BACL|nr:AraC family transcriptional regulator [Paenibacillus profundus]MCE5172914.1 GyrI-like domain-containing protein [Paenibacillus profundus]